MLALVSYSSKIYFQNGSSFALNLTQINRLNFSKGGYWLFLRTSKVVETVSQFKNPDQIEFCMDTKITKTNYFFFTLRVHVHVVFSDDFFFHNF